MRRGVPLLVETFELKTRLDMIAETPRQAKIEASRTFEKRVGIALHAGLKSISGYIKIGLHSTRETLFLVIGQPGHACLVFVPAALPSFIDEADVLRRVSLF